MLKLSEVVGDPIQNALATFGVLETLGPINIHDHVYMNPQERKEDAERRNLGGTTPPRTAAQRACDIADAKSEMARRLRSSMWAEVTLRNTEHFDYANMLGTWHREKWRVPLVSDDRFERERQVDSAVKNVCR